MAITIGTNPYRPGQLLPFKPDGRVCDFGECDVEARHCVVGETDSHGSELLFYCSAHYLEQRTAAEEQKKELQFCEIHQGLAIGCTKVRDPDEGMCGRLYTACPDCRSQLLAVDPEEVNDALDDYDPPTPDDFDGFDDFLDNNDPD